MERVVVMLHLKSDMVKKVWRFDPSRIAHYSRAIVKDEISQLFPDISRKGFRLNLWYEDDIAAWKGTATYSHATCHFNLADAFMQMHM